MNPLDRIRRLFDRREVLPDPCPSTIPRPWAHRFYAAHWTPTLAKALRDPPKQITRPFKPVFVSGYEDFLLEPARRWWVA